ncbi:hypothetical protein pb186bvf_020341 [Paramecium bursaria]
MIANNSSKKFQDLFQERIDQFLINSSEVVKDPVIELLEKENLIQKIQKIEDYQQK